MKLFSSLLLTGTLWSGAAHAADLTVTAFGGVWEQAFRACYVSEFEKRTGKKVEVLIGNPVQWANQIAANPAHPPVDVMVNIVDGAYEMQKRGLAEAITAEKLPRLSEITPAFVAAGRGYGFVLNYGAMGLAYNSKTVKKPPATWQEFVEGTVRGDWKAALPSINVPGAPASVIWTLATVFGGSADDIGPGLAQIKRMKDSGNLVFYNDVNEILGLLQSGEVDIGQYQDGRTWAFHDDGHPEIMYLNPKPGSAFLPVIVQKVRNGSDLAWQFLDVLASAEPQACWGGKLQYGMSNMNIHLDAKAAARITKISDVLDMPFEKISANTATWIERWNREVAR